MDHTSIDLSKRRWMSGCAFCAMGLGWSHAFAREGVEVGEQSKFSKFVNAEDLEKSAAEQYRQLLQNAAKQNALGPETHPQVVRLRNIGNDLIPYSYEWNPRARSWKWEVNLIGSKQINAFCMPGGKIAFYTGLLTQLKLSDDESAMVMGHEMAHAVREHARARIAKSQGTSIGLSVLSQVLGLGQLGDMAANVGTQLLSLKFSREDETDADLVGLELSARGAYEPDASVRLWEKMGRASGGSDGPAFLSTHPTGPDRIARLRENVPKVRALYEQAAGLRGAR